MTGSASRRLGRRKGGVGLIRGGVRSLERRLRDVRGQSTVEAAVMIPLLFGGMLMLLQPGILLYDRVVMEGAAAEGCRVLATASGGAVGSGEGLRETQAGGHSAPEQLSPARRILLLADRPDGRRVIGSGGGGCEDQGAASSSAGLWPGAAGHIGRRWLPDRACSGGAADSALVELRVLGGVGCFRVGGCVDGSIGKGKEKGNGRKSLRLPQGAALS